MSTANVHSQRTEKVTLSKLQVCPVRVVVHTEKEILQREAAAKKSTSDLPQLIVGELPSGEQYVIKGHSTLEVLQRLEIDYHEATILSVENLRDIVILHTKKSQSSPIDPLGIYDLGQYLKEFPKDEIIRQCSLRPHLHKLIGLEMPKINHDLLSDWREDLIRAVNTIEMPVWLVVKMAQIPEEESEHYVRDIKKLVYQEKPISDKNNCWPTMFQISSIRTSASKAFVPVTFNPTDPEIENSTKTKPKSFTVVKSGENLKKTAALVCSKNPHQGLVELKDKSGEKTIFRIDWKKKTMDPLDTKEDFVVFKDSLHLKEGHTVPHALIEYLGTDEPFTKKITNIEMAKKILEKLKTDKSFKIFVISNQKF